MPHEQPIGLVKVEKLGGFAGFGAGSHLRSDGEIDLRQLPEPDRAAIERLLAEPRPATASPSRDAFRYRLTWTSEGETRSVEIDESEAPAVVRSAVTDRLV